MSKKMYKNIISKVKENSIADELGIEPGDVLVSINGKIINDVIDYLFQVADDYIEVEIEKKDGEIWLLEIDKDYNEDLGIAFNNPILDKAKHCQNKCIFCFVDQLPKNMRKTLYFKDDDSRLSFLQGNFVTLTNLSDEDIDRIIKYNISPINVSIHTTDPDLRIKMLNNKNAGNVLKRLKQLTDNRIIVNGQIVLCPNINDGDNLDKTIKDIYPMYPNLHSIAIVPVGVTKYRKNLYYIDTFSKEKALEVIRQIERWQSFLKQKIGTNFVYLSDEFYILADEKLPDYKSYEDFPQLENGVGLMRKFEQEFFARLKSLPNNLTINKSIGIVTGTSAKPFLNKLAQKLTEKIDKLKINVYSIKNKFFGETITVSGLITGQDIIEQLKHKNLEEEILIPKSMLKAEEDIFLDDITLKDIEKSLNTKVTTCEVNGQTFIDTIIK